jgi:hypothetical protein
LQRQQQQQRRLFHLLHHRPRRQLHPAAGVATDRTIMDAPGLKLVSESSTRPRSDPARHRRAPHAADLRARTSDDPSYKLTNGSRAARRARCGSASHGLKPGPPDNSASLGRAYLIGCVLALSGSNQLHLLWHQGPRGGQASCSSRRPDRPDVDVRANLGVGAAVASMHPDRHHE